MRPATLLCLFFATVLSVPVNEAPNNTCVEEPSAPQPDPNDDNSAPAANFTAAQLLQIVPKANTCDGAPAPGECQTAAQATPFILDSFKKYNITHAPVQAALISLMAYETADFKYKKNHFPGVLGQGTSNMQSPNFNEAYAKDLGLPSSNLEQMMDHLMQDKYSFASAAWFVVTRCPYSIRTNMWNGSRTAWEAYLTSCVHTAANDERVPYWERAMKVLTGMEPAA